MTLSANFSNSFNSISNIFSNFMTRIFWKSNSPSSFLDETQPDSLPSELTDLHYLHTLTHDIDLNIVRVYKKLRPKILEFLVEDEEFKNQRPDLVEFIERFEREHGAYPIGTTEIPL